MQTTTMAKLGDEIRRRLDALGMKQIEFLREIEKRSGMVISRPTLTRIISGNTENPHQSNLQMIMRTLTDLEKANDGLPPGQTHDPLAGDSHKRSSQS